MDKLFFILLSLVNFLGATACIWLLVECHTIARYWFLRVGVGIFAFGLLGQLWRNTEFILTGISPTDADWPLWALKDLGGFMVATWFAYMLFFRPEYLGRLLSAVLGHGVAVVDVPKKPAVKKAPAKTVAKQGSVKKPVRRQT